MIGRGSGRVIRRHAVTGSDGGLAAHFADAAHVVGGAGADLPSFFAGGAGFFGGKVVDFALGLSGAATFSGDLALEQFVPAKPPRKPRPPSRRSRG